MIDPLYAFVFFGLFSPGPNVILLTASGARFGVVPSLPHLFGVVLGVGIIAGVTGYGVGAALQAMPRLTLALQAISALWILYMAYRLWIAEPWAQSEQDRPMRFGEAVLFQWVNPKIWAVALAAAGGFPSGFEPTWEALRLGSAFSGTNLFVCLFWTFCGALLSLLMTTPAAWRLFNRVMALALAAFSAMLFV